MTYSRLQRERECGSRRVYLPSPVFSRGLFLTQSPSNVWPYRMYLLWSEPKYLHVFFRWLCTVSPPVCFRALWLLFTTLSCFALPGFDVNEWIILDTLARPDVPMVMLNGNLDKVRKGAS